jgi:hypothetical protein
MSYFVQYTTLNQSPEYAFRDIVAVPGMVIFQIFSLVSFPLMWRQIAHASKYLKSAGRTINRTGLIIAVSVAVFSAVLVTVFMVMGKSEFASRTSSSSHVTSAQKTREKHAPHGPSLVVRVVIPLTLLLTLTYVTRNYPAYDL